MPRVLRIINRFNLGGPTYNAAYLTKYLSPSFETLLVGGMKEDSEESSEFILDDLGVEYRSIPEMRRSIDPLKDRKVLQRIRTMIREFKPDIVHTHASKAGAVGRRAAFKEGVPLVFHTFHGHVFHSYFGKWRTHFYKAIERRLARDSTGLIALSEEQKEELTSQHRICSPEKVEVLPLGFDLARFQEGMEEKRKKFRQRWGLQQDEPALAILGRLVPVKGHELFLEGVARAKRKEGVPSFKAFIVGDGEEKAAMMERARELGLRIAGPDEDTSEADLVFTSWLREVDELWAGMDLAVLTSFNEGTPVSLIEAHAAGLPVISTKVGGVSSIVADGESGHLLRDRDPDELAEAMGRYLSDPSMREEQGECGRDRVKERFSVDRLVSDMETLYLRELSRTKA